MKGEKRHIFHSIYVISTVICSAINAFWICKKKIALLPHNQNATHGINLNITKYYYITSRVTHFVK